MTVATCLQALFRNKCELRRARDRPLKADFGEPIFVFSNPLNLINAFFTPLYKAIQSLRRSICEVAKTFIAGFTAFLTRNRSRLMTTCRIKQVSSENRLTN